MSGCLGRSCSGPQPRWKKPAATRTSICCIGPSAVDSETFLPKFTPASPLVPSLIPPLRMASDTAQLSKAEQRRQQTHDRRENTAAEVLKASTEIALRPTQSFAAQTFTKALPREL